MFKFLPLISLPRIRKFFSTKEKISTGLKTIGQLIKNLALPKKKAEFTDRSFGTFSNEARDLKHPRCH